MKRASSLWLFGLLWFGSTLSRANAFLDVLENLFCVLGWFRWNNCVCTEFTLRQAFSALDNNIVLCRASQITLSSPITIQTNANIQLTCPTTFWFLFSTSCVIDGNSATRLFHGTNVASIQMTGVTLQNGRAPDNQGGAALSLTNASNLLLTSVQLMNHHAPGTGANGSGGAVDMKQGGSLTMTACKLTDNSANVGGALAYQGANKNSGTLDIFDCVFVRNTATSGGAMIVQGGTTTITDSFFLDNEAEADFGGALALNVVQMTLSNTVFSGNRADTRAVSFDIRIADDLPPSTTGTNLQCLDNNVVFCNGRAGILEFGSPDVNDNTNCDTEGLEGTIGQGRC